MSSTIIDLNNPAAVRRAGVEALTKELGPLGMALFMRQFDTGYGDYTLERDELLDNSTITDFEHDILTIRNAI